MPRAKYKPAGQRLLAWRPAALTPEELTVLAEIFERSKQLEQTPDEYRDDLHEIFADFVRDLAGRYRAEIPHEFAMPTAGEIRAVLGRAVKLADSLERDAKELLELLGTLDERTRAALLVREDLLPRGWSIESVQGFLVGHPQFKALAGAARLARERYRDAVRVPSGARRRAGSAVKALCDRFAIPYHRTEATENAVDSDAVRLFRMVSNILDVRVEHYLP